MPICGIYKIANQINGKCYIGQSINIKRRWRSHKTKSFNPLDIQYECPLYRAFRKYGLENFSFEILEECRKEELNEKESFYIKKYNSNLESYGYNLTPGGDSNGPTLKKLTEEQLQEIFKFLEFSNLSQTEIAKKYGVTQQVISEINRGNEYFCEDKNYPIRSASQAIKISKAKKKINDGREIKEWDDLLQFSVQKCQQCGKIFYGGEDRKFCSQDCSHLARRVVLRPSREVLKAEVRQESFLSLSRKYKVADSTIRKWCKAYNLPSKSSIIKSYSDEEWNEI